MDNKAQQITTLLESAQSVLCADLCLHDFFQKTGIAPHWQHHRSPCCEKHRQDNFTTCKNFDGQKVHQQMAASPEGTIHQCPFSNPEIAVPVISDNMLCGVLFAGGFRGETGTGALENMRLLLLCIAEKVGRIIEADRNKNSDAGTARTAVIMQWIENNIARQLTLAELAEHLHLSVSRAGKLVRETFLVSFTELVQANKLNTAAYWLCSSNLTISEITHRLGYCDQAYFTRLFTRRFCVSPARYRKDALNRQINS